MTTPTIEQLTARAEAAEASVLVLRSALEWCRGVAAAGGKTLAESEPIKSALTDTAPLAAKVRQEIVDAALERAAWVCDHDKEHGINLLARILAIEIRKLKGKPL